MHRRKELAVALLADASCHNVLDSLVEDILSLRLKKMILKMMCDGRQGQESRGVKRQEMSSKNAANKNSTFN